MACAGRPPSGEIMKLTSVFPQIKTDNKIQKSSGSASTKPVAGSVPLAADKVEFSAGSREVLKMQELLQEAPDVRQELVADLKRQVEDGSYQVDPYKVADKMLKSLLSDV